MPGKSLERRMVDTENLIRQLKAQKRLLAQRIYSSKTLA